MKLSLPYGLIAATLGLSILAACGDDANNNTKVEAPLTAAQFFTSASAAFVEAQCKSIFQCPEREGDAIETLGRFKDVEDCKASFSKLILFGEDFEEGLKAGRIKYDSSTAKACLTTLEAATTKSVCATEDEFEEEPAECEQLFVGQVADGGSCLNSNECAGELKCSFDDDQTCAGVCKVDPCLSCTDAQYCDSFGSTPVCKDLAALGESCSYFKDYCVEGASCFYGEDGGESGKCIANMSVELDGACDEHEQCKSGQCGGDSTCITANLPPALGKDGEECHAFKLCQPGLSCQDLIEDTDEGTCKPLAAKGADCNSNAQCEFELFCQGADATTKGKCADRLADGQACVYSQDCKSFTCDGDTNKCVSQMMCSI